MASLPKSPKVDHTHLNLLWVPGQVEHTAPKSCPPTSTKGYYSATTIITAVAENGIDTNKEAGLTISGQILIPARISSFHGATAHINVEELKGEDTSAKVVAKAIIQDVSHESVNGEDTTVPFKIQISPAELDVSSENDYAVRIWVDYNSDGERGHGDLYSDERYSVFTGRSERPVIIKLVQR